MTTKATTTTPTTNQALADENRLYGHLIQNCNADLYDTLTLHREQLEQLETLITQVKKELSDTDKYEHVGAKTMLDIAQYLALNFADDTQRHIDKIESLAPTTPTATQ